MKSTRIFLLLSALALLFCLPQVQVSSHAQGISDISGRWTSNIGLKYEIEQHGTTFTWRVIGREQPANGSIRGDTLTARWRGPAGGEQSATGKITRRDPEGRALRIEWSNGVVFTRESPEGAERPEEGPPPGERPEQRGALDLSGLWYSNLGPKVQISQSGSNFQWRIEGGNENGAGIIEGETAHTRWPTEEGLVSISSQAIEREPSGRAVFIAWSNGMHFSREPHPPRERPEEEGRPMEEERPGEEGRPREEERPGREAINIAGGWFSNTGKQYRIDQEGPGFLITDLATGKGFEGVVAGKQLHVPIGEQLLVGNALEIDPEGGAHLIEWPNGLLLAREPFPREAQIAGDLFTAGGEEHERPGERPEPEPMETRPRVEGSVNIGGTWSSTIRRTYLIWQQGDEFTWSVRGTEEQAQGRIERGNIWVEWSGEFGSGHAEGQVSEIDDRGMATRITWNNGVIFTRESFEPVEDADRKTQPQRLELADKARLEGVKSVQLSRAELERLMPHLTLRKTYNKWVKVGGPIGGLGYDVRYLADNARGRSVMFVTDNYSGVNKSVDGGDNWFASNDGITGRSGASLDAIPVFCLTVDPNNPSIVWAGLKDVKGVYKSTDAGVTWQEVTPQMPEKEFVFRGFTIMPGDSDTVYAQGELPTGVQGLTFDKVKGRIYRTEDAGATWRKVWDGSDLVRYVIIHPQNHDILYASCGIFDREAFNSDCTSPTLKTGDLEISWQYRGGVGVLRSKDGGRRWEELNRKNGLTDLYVGSLVMHPTVPEILLAGCGNNSASPYIAGGKHHLTGGVFLTVDGGNTWAQTLKDDVITSVEFSLSSPNIAYAGSRQRFYASNDAGKTWKIVAGQNYPWGPPGVIAGFPIDILVDPTDPNIIFANNYGGGNVKSVDGGKTWTIASQGYTGALMFDLALDQQNSDVVYAAARSGTFRTRHAGIGWEGLSVAPAVLPESYAVAVHPKNPQIVFASQELGGQVYGSINGGNTWQKVLQLPIAQGTPLESFGFKRIVFAPSNPQVVYAATCRGSNHLEKKKSAFGIYKSTSAGAPNTWNPANNQLTQNLAVSDIAVHPNNHFVVYAATVTGGLFKTTDGGGNWKPISELANRDVRSVAIDPSNPKTVYAGLQSGGAYVSIDDGNTWYPMVAGMDANESVWALVVEPAAPHAPWAGTLRSGVFRYDSIEQQWIKVNSGLSMRTVVDLEFSSDGKVIYAATSGEGVFRYEKNP